MDRQRVKLLAEDAKSSGELVAEAQRRAMDGIFAAFKHLEQAAGLESKPYAEFEAVVSEFLSMFKTPLAKSPDRFLARYQIWVGKAQSKKVVKASARAYIDKK